MPQNHALIFGASGVSGWALAKEALSFPQPASFARVTALTNRPIAHSDSKFPTDSRLQLASGVDLTGSVPSIVDGLRSKIPDVSGVTHVFFMAYIDTPGDREELVRINTLLVRNAITAIDQLAGESLQAVILQTGGKHYGLEFPDQVTIKAPLMEDAPRITTKPIADKIIYYPMYDAVKELSQGKDWRFYEVRPDVIVGFVPSNNAMNAALGFAFYLTLYREVYGEGAEVPFVGSPGGWKCKHTDTFQDILAKQQIHVALNAGSIPSGTSFNCANGDLVTWEQKWPELAAYFGLKGVGPKNDKYVDMGAFAKEHEATWKKLEESKGLKKGIFEKHNWMFIRSITVGFNFDRQYDLTRSREVGFKEEIKTTDGFKTSFDRLRAAKTIP